MMMIESDGQLRLATWLPGLVVLTLVASAGADFTVSGTITDFVGDPIPQIRVDIWDQDVQQNDHLGTVYTNATGNYSALISGGYGFENPDIFIFVAWQFPLLPASDYNGHHIKLLNKTNLANCGVDPAAIPFTDKTSPVTVDHDPDTDLSVDLQMDQEQDNLADLHAHINEALDYYKDNRGTVAWSVQNDIKVNIRTVDHLSFFCRNNQAIYIAELDITGAGDGRVSDIYHEMGHLVHYRFNNNSLPPVNCPSPHFENAEGDPGCALVEGWASYMAELTSNVHGQDNKYEDYRDDADTHWRGDEATPTGLDLGVYESGEDVEGAVSGVWFGIHDHALFNFEDNFRVMVEDDPNHIFDFCTGFVNDFGGFGMQVDAMYEIVQTHGIVYNRVRFTADPFSGETEPPDAAPPEDGNYKIIDSIPFLRGTVTTAFEDVPIGDLGVDQSIQNNRGRIAFKEAHDDLYDCPLDFADWTLFAGIGGGSVELDTTSFDGSPGQGGDGDWDLLLTAENVNLFVDNLLPTWSWSPLVSPCPPGPPAPPPPGTPDGNPAVDTDEEYLKTLGAWFDLDRDPGTSTNDQGKVVVDNTPPGISNPKP